NVRALPPATLHAGGGHLLWLTRPGGCVGYPVALADVYALPRADRTLGDSVWPQVRDGSACAGEWQGGSVGWRGLPVRGRLVDGAPAGGDYVPRGNVGTDYRSPGYDGGIGAVITRIVQALACRASGACGRAQSPRRG